MKKLLTLFTVLCLCFSCSFGAFAASDTTTSGGTDTGTTSDPFESLFPEVSDPVITVKQNVIPNLKAGTSGFAEFTVENTSFSFASDIILTVTSDSADIKIAPEDSIISVGALSAYGSSKVAVPVSVSPSANGQYSLSVSISCVTTTGFFSQQTFNFSGKASLVVSRGSAVMQPVIKDMKFDAAEYFAGDLPVLSFTVENPNDFAIYSVSPTLSGFVDGAVDAIFPDQSFYIDRLGANESKTFTVKMKTSDSVAAQIYNFTLKLTASDDFGTEYAAEKSAYFTVVEKTADEFTAQSPRIIIDSYKMSPSNAQPGDTVRLTIDLLNLGVLDAENVKVSLGGYDAQYITLREITPEKTVSSVDVMKTATVEYSMTLSSVFPQDTNVPLTVFLSYGDLTGKNYADQSIINIMSITPEEKPEDEKPGFEVPVYKIPKVIIESFVTDTELIGAGTEFDLTFTLRNTSEDLDVENLRITLVDSGTNAGIFTPVNSGYSFFMDEIEKLGEHTLSIPLFAKVSTESGIYSLNFQIEYEYYVKTGEKTGEYRSNSLVETISLKVVQPINIEVSNFYCDYSTYANGQSYISFSYNNKSRSNLYFMNIDIEGNATMAEGKLEMGSIPSGYSDYIDFAINIGEEIGEQEFAIVFNFKDSLNQESSIRYPFTMIVEEQPVYEEPVYNEEDFYMPEVSEPMEEETGAISMTTWIIIGVAGAVVIAVVIIIIVVAVKKKKAKEEEDESI
ncbi:MAG: hypothetical protein J6D42_10470 [Clostridia bacterium]|nr:hypothetical protein [Clostridia bacterium]